jgi:YidC/Oxa1 family membrane protein insertase
MNVFFDVVAQALAYVYAIWNNYAWAITGLTLLIMVILTPLTLKGTRSMMVMQQLQPEMKKIQTRYKDDRQKLNEELLKFYKENDISPLGGCLPLLVQMPVFIVLYAVLRGLTRRVSLMGFNLGFNSGQLAPPTTPVKPPTPTLPQNSYFDPSYVRHNTTLYQNLSHTNTMYALGMDLSQSARSAMGSGVAHAAPYFILILIVGVTGWIQQRQIQGRTPAAQSNQQQQAIMKMMPFLLPVISFGLPAGLVLYFAVSNIYRVGQQWFISRSIYGPAGATGDTKSDKSPTGPDAPAAAKAAQKTATKTPAKTTAKTPSKAGGNGAANRSTRQKTTGAAKTSTGNGAANPSTKSSGSPPAPSKTRAAGGSPGGQPAPKSKSSDASPAPAKPVLQPRARKNKKG